MKNLPALVLTIVVATLLWSVVPSVSLPIEKPSSYGPEGVTLSVVKQENSTCEVIQDGGMFIIRGLTCTSIKNITIDGTSLGIKNTGLVSLGPDDFSSFLQLTSLTIDLNQKLVKIADGSFQHLKKLSNLTISLNLGTQLLSANLFQGLGNLRHLGLINNGLKSFHTVSIAVRPAILPSLITLDTSRNIFSTVSANDTMYLDGSSIENLYMTRCSINWIEPKALNNLHSLKNLRIDNNRLPATAIISLIESLGKAVPSWKSINVQSNLINDPYGIMSAVASTNIEWLDASHGSAMAAAVLQDVHTIPFMPNVKYLDVSASLTGLQTSVFLGRETLPTIESLYLRSDWLFVYHLTISLPNLKVLDLSNNSPHKDCGALENNNFSLVNCTSLEELDLSFNPASALKSDFFKGAPNLKRLRVSNSSLKEIEPFALSLLKHLEILDLSSNNFQDTESLNRTSFSGLMNLKSLNLASSSISCIADDKTFEDLSQLQLLDLRQNGLLELHEHLLDPLTNLELLYLGYNSFQSWNYRIFRNNKQLQTVELNDNQITTFYSAMVEDLSVPRLTKLNRNPFACDCNDLSVLIEFLKSPDNKGASLVESLSEPNTFCASPASLRFSSLISYTNGSHLTDECFDEGVTAVIFGVVCTFATLFIIGTIASYFLRWHIKYWVFLLRQFLAGHIFPKKKNQSNEGKYIYDAFVSYSNEDRGFVVRLVSMLESHAPYFRLCVFERDFEVGGVITDNVVNSLEKSKRTILILSDAYAKSTWCQWELQLAQHKRLFFKDDRHGPLIIIKIGEIMDKHMTPTLRYLIKTRIYLQWNSDLMKQKVFWEKLRFALSASLDDDVESRPGLQKTVLSKSESNNVVEEVEVRDTSNKPGQTTEE